jgi:vacuolar-type H+-ATPase subunit H
MVFKANEYDSYSFTKDVPLPESYIINESGMKCVSDGNEYGIYMSTNDLMSLNYATPSIFSASPIGNGLQIGMDRAIVGMPAIGVLMEIDTSGLDIKEPYINPVLKGHYNNGYEGKEWISTEVIPLTNVSYSKLIIGPDLLHDAKTYDNIGASAIKPTINKEMVEREMSLTKLYNFLKDEPTTTLLRMNFKDYKDSFKMMFVEGCLEKTVTDFDLSTREGLHKALLCNADKKEGGITLKDVRKIDNEMRRLLDRDIQNKSPKYEELVSLLSEDKSQDSVITEAQTAADKIIQDAMAKANDIIKSANEQARTVLDKTDFMKGYETAKADTAKALEAGILVDGAKHREVVKQLSELTQKYNATMLDLADKQPDIDREQE